MAAALLGRVPAITHGKSQATWAEHERQEPRGTRACQCTAPRVLNVAAVDFHRYPTPSCTTGAHTTGWSGPCAAGNTQRWRQGALPHIATVARSARANTSGGHAPCSHSQPAFPTQLSAPTPNAALLCAAYAIAARLEPPYRDVPRAFSILKRLEVARVGHLNLPSPNVKFSAVRVGSGTGQRSTMFRVASQLHRRAFIGRGSVVRCVYGTRGAVRSVCGATRPALKPEKVRARRGACHVLLPCA